MTFTEKYGNVELRALSWKQPFASLMLHGKIETRVWDSKYRGWVLICASKAAYSDSELFHVSCIHQIEIIKDMQIDWPFGKAIAIGRLANSRFMLPIDEDLTFVEYHEPWLYTSKKTGKKSWKRLWCHVYEDVQPIEPFNHLGTQGWSTTPDHLKDKIILL